MTDSEVPRRNVLAAAAIAGSLGGCAGLFDDDDEAPTPTPATDTPPGSSSNPTEQPSPTEQPTPDPEGEYYVGPSGSDDAPGTEAAPLETIREGLTRAQPGETVHLKPGEYREEVWTLRAGEPDAPITITGPPEAVIRPSPGANDCLVIEHSHFHVRGITINGLLEPDRKYEDSEAWADRCVFITPAGRKDEGVEYVRDVVVEPSRMGNCGRAMVQINRLRNASIGNFEVVGPAGMQFDDRVANSDHGHVREIVYVGTVEVDRGTAYHPYETLDKSRDIRIHHIDNSEGYRHNELVDVKLGSSNVTIEYCTTRNAGHNSEAVVNAAIDLKGNDCTVRWNDIGASPLPFSFGAWAPSADVDRGDWSRGNEIYGNHIHGFAAGVFRLRNEDDVTPVSFDDQRRICGNRIERGDPDLDRWVGDANGFDGSAVDRRGTDEVTVTVGAGPDERALDPPAVFVDRGTEVTWEWTGDDEHYVVRQERVGHDPETVPDPLSSPYDESKPHGNVGFYRYACYAHHEGGMRGAVIVREPEARYEFARQGCAGDVPSGDGVGHTGGDSPWKE